LVLGSTCLPPEARRLDAASSTDDVIFQRLPGRWLCSPLHRGGRGDRPVHHTATAPPLACRHRVGPSLSHGEDHILCTPRPRSQNAAALRAVTGTTSATPAPPTPTTTTDQQTQQRPAWPDQAGRFQSRRTHEFRTR